VPGVLSRVVFTFMLTFAKFVILRGNLLVGVFLKAAHMQTSGKKTFQRQCEHLIICRRFVGSSEAPLFGKWYFDATFHAHILSDMAGSSWA
jgi:hypothetical protein